jgi:lauroyl/myristoyl acyltransferase
MAHIMCNCRQKGFSFINKRHRAICDAVITALRKGYPGVRIHDDERINQICAELTNEEGGLKRPDLMYETFITKKGVTKKIFNLTEITSPWAWKHSLDAAYDNRR